MLINVNTIKRCACETLNQGQCETLNQGQCFPPIPYWYKIRIVFFLILPSTPTLGNAPASHFARMLRMLEGWIQALVHRLLSSVMSC